MTTETYGLDVIEFFKHDDAELKKLISQRVTQYHHNSEGLGYKGMAGSVDFVRHKPLEMSLIELQDEILQGYRIVKANADALFFKAILRKPERVIKAELKRLEELVQAEYEKNRFERNVAETTRQIEITVSMQRRKAEAEAEALRTAALAAQHASEAEAALADLRRAYSEPNLDA